jgi:hypothetical protein
MSGYRTCAMDTLQIITQPQGRNPGLCSDMDGTGGHHVKRNKPDTEDRYCMFPPTWKLKRKKASK